MHKFGFEPGLLNPNESDIIEVHDGLSLVPIPGNNFLLRAAYDRLGPDLLLTHEGHAVLLKNYFNVAYSPDLLSGSGTSVVRGDLASKLAGPSTPRQFAQVTDTALADAGDMQAIGEVTTVEGKVSIVRSDREESTVEAGAEIFQGDIVSTGEGGAIGIVFLDDSNFALGEGGRMVIDELVYSPAEKQGKSAFSIVEGVFSFASGKIAQTGSDSMLVKTPVITIGVRGTKVAGRAAEEGGENTVTLLPEADGTVGEISVRNSEGTQVLNQPFQTTTLSSAFTAPSIPQIISETAVEQLYGNSVINIVNTQVINSSVVDPEENDETDSASDSDGESDEEQGEDSTEDNADVLDESGSPEEEELEEELEEEPGEELEEEPGEELEEEPGEELEEEPGEELEEEPEEEPEVNTETSNEETSVEEEGNVVAEEAAPEENSDISAEPDREITEESEDGTGENDPPEGSDTPDEDQENPAEANERSEAPEDVPQNVEASTNDREGVSERVDDRPPPASDDPGQIQEGGSENPEPREQTEAGPETEILNEPGRPNPGSGGIEGEAPDRNPAESGTDTKSDARPIGDQQGQIGVSANTPSGNPNNTLDNANVGGNSPGVTDMPLRPPDQAREAYDEAVSSGAGEEDALRAAANAVGRGEVFEQALASAISQGQPIDIGSSNLSNPESLNFAQPTRGEVETARGQISTILQEPRTSGPVAVQDIIQNTVKLGGGNERALDATREAVYGVFDATFSGNASSTDVTAFTSFISQTDSVQTAEGQVFINTLNSGQSIDSAFQAVNEALRPNIQSKASNALDFIANESIARQFDPFLQASVIIENTLSELESELSLSAGTITSFEEIITFDLDDNFVTGGTQDSTFEMSQGSTLGGNDIVLDLGGQDQITFDNLSNILFSYDSETATMNYSTFDGELAGSVSLPAGTSVIEQIFLADLGGTSQRLLVPDTDGGSPNSIGLVLSGTSGSDFFDMRGDGTSSPDLIAGSISVDIDNADVFGTILFGGNGADTLAGTRLSGNIVRGGAGDDTLIVASTQDSMFGEDGNDTFILENNLLTTGITINGGSNTATGFDQIQFGTPASANNELFTFSNMTVVGIEKITIVPTGSTITSTRNFLFQLKEVETSNSATNVTIKSENSELNLANTNISAGITTLEATSSSANNGVNITDGLDNFGRTLVGTSNEDFLSGREGNDLFLPGDGPDIILGGPGDDRIFVNSASNMSAAKSISGGEGRDALIINSTTIDKITASNNLATTTLEVIDLRGGSPSGVEFSVEKAADIDNVGIGVEIIGDGVKDKVIFRDSASQVKEQFTFDGINVLELKNTQKRIDLDLSSDTTVKNVSALKIKGSTHAQINEQGPHQIQLIQSAFNSQSTPSFDFSDTTLSGVQVSARASNLHSTISFNENTNFGTSTVRGSFGGSDVLDYKSTLTTSNGTIIDVIDDLEITRISAPEFRTDYLTNNTTGIIDFEFSRLSIEATASTEKQILSGVETLLESNNLTGIGSVQAAGANAELLLITHSQSGKDSIMVLYQEGSATEEDFANELSLIGVFGASAISDSSIT